MTVLPLPSPPPPRPERPAPPDAAAGPEALRAALDRLAAGATWRAALERLLLELPADRASLLQQLLREGRGAWLLHVAAAGGDALVVGNALSGTAVALADAGFRVALAEPDGTRLALALHRARALGGRPPLGAVRADGRLPFPDGRFDLVVAEASLPVPGAGIDLAECRRVARDELVLVADNRLGYKRSSGHRGDFRVPRPLEWLAGALAPRDGARTLSGWRRALARVGLRNSTALALYPDARDFALLAAVDASDPRLPVGPKERRNRLKVAAYRAGLFPVFAPSFAVVAAPRPRADSPRRAERLLAAIAERLGEPVPAPEVHVATRGNSSVLLTRLANAGEEEPRGRWAVHVPHSPSQDVQVSRHHARLGELRDRFPAVPVPEPLLEGEAEGLRFTCERRLPGLPAPQLSGDHAAMARLFRDASEHLAQLVLRRACVDDLLFERLVGDRIDLVARHAAVPATVRWLGRARDEARELLLGVDLPLVLYHADVRSKHVVCRADGSVTGYLDWGSSEDEGPPYFDLLHLVVHERKQESGRSAGDEWRAALAGELRDHERDALDRYCALAGVPAEARRAVEVLYPALVGAMAEANWDYSRPRWLHASFGV